MHYLKCQLKEIDKNLSQKASIPVVSNLSGGTDILESIVTFDFPGNELGIKYQEIHIPLKPIHVKEFQLKEREKIGYQLL